MGEAPSSHPEFFDVRYSAGEMPWDFGGVPKALRLFLESRPGPGNVLVPGCGSGYEIEAFYSRGWDAVGIDFSAVGVKRARSLLGPLADRAYEGDFFTYPLRENWFDIIYERTFLCALPPEMRSRYAQRIAKLIVPSGVLCGFFFFGPEDDPPPYPILSDELDELLGNWFTKIEDRAVEDSLELYADKERWQVWKRNGFRSLSVAMERQNSPAVGYANHFSVVLSFHGDLGFFVQAKERYQPITRTLTRKTSIKDLIESCGVPHPEVDLIIVNGQPVDFSFQVESDTAFDIYPTSAELFSTFRLQERNVRAFVADGHLGKLARDLRLLGIDVSYRQNPTDRELLDTMAQENRALLTRDRPLLMHRVVRTGYYPRSQRPIEQTVEVVRRFGLVQALAPFVRCLRCNGVLRSVSKEAIIDQLEPLTRFYYDDFQVCPNCGQPYWRGSHVVKLEKRVQAILAHLGVSALKSSETSLS